MTRALILRTDLEAVTREDDSVLFTERTLDQYLEAQHLVLKQVSNNKKKQQQRIATKRQQQKIGTKNSNKE